MKKINRILTVVAGVFLAFTLTGCYSVFYGGASGTVVDGSTTSLTGISGVDVYGYISKSDRDKDVNNWMSRTSDETFTPSAKYYGHTKTGTDGSFSISKMYWKAYFPDFGKDADYTTLYLLYYHENYGVNVGDAIIMSEVTTDSIYNEIEPIKKSVNLNLKFYDVTDTENTTSNSLFVKVTVPQTGYKQSTSSYVPEAKVYKATVTNGTAAINVTYPRWSADTAADKRNSDNEQECEITVEYYQNVDDDEVSWMPCYNNDSEKAYSFLLNNENNNGAVFIKTLPASASDSAAWPLSFYGKKCKFDVPVYSGQYVNANDATDDGISILMNVDVTGGTSYTLDCGSVSTAASSLGNGVEKHGVFTGLGTGTFTNNSYDAKYLTLGVQFSWKNYAGTSKTYETTIRSDNSAATVTLKE